MRYTATQIKHWDVDCGDERGNWKPARSLNHTLESLSSRIKNAWGVLIGKFDALDWE